MMTVQFIGVAHVSGKDEPNRFANKHLFIIDKAMSFIEMRNEAMKITQDRANKKTTNHNKKFGSIAVSRNTVVITSSSVFEEMKDYVEKNLCGNDKHFIIPVSNGLVMTVDSNSGRVEECNEGKPFYITVSARIDSNGVKDVYHYSGWSTVNPKLAGIKDLIIPWWSQLHGVETPAEDGEFIIPWWMELHDHQSPSELRPGGLTNVVPR